MIINYTNFLLNEELNNIELIIHNFFDMRKTNQSIKKSILSFKDIYEKYTILRNEIKVDTDCETGYEIYDEILNIVKSNINNDTMTVYRAIYIADNIADNNKIYNYDKFSYYKGVGGYWSFNKKTYPMDNNSDLEDLTETNQQILITANATPDVIDWDSTFKHSVSFQSGENEITLSNGVVFVTKCSIFDDNDINIIKTYDINTNVSI